MFFAFLRLLRDPLGSTTELVRRYGDIVRLRVGTMQSYLLTSPELIEEVLRHQHRCFRKDSGTRLLSGFLGQGLLTNEGETWRRQRRLAQPAFQLERIQKYGEVMVAFTDTLLADWKAGQTRDIHTDMMRLTLRIAARTLFGAGVETEEEETVGQALEAVMKYYAGPVGQSLAFFPFLAKLPTPSNRRYQRALAQIDRVVYATISKGRAAGGEGSDLLSRLLAATDEDGSRMSDQQLRDEVVTLLLAGHETTALALSFTFYLLAKNPTAADRLAAELQEVLEGRLPTSADVPRLHYTEWVLKEAMRLYPPAPAIGREAIEDCEIGGYPVRKGTQIGLLQWIVHRDPRWFDDPEAFKPERWANDLARRLPRCAYFPFGDGPRICIGSQFAMIEGILLLATIAQRFRLSLAPGFDLELMPSITLRPKHGLKMSLAPSPLPGAVHAEPQAGQLVTASQRSDSAGVML
jgi:cytochrome P450